MYISKWIIYLLTATMVSQILAVQEDKSKPFTVVTSLFIFENPAKPQGFYLEKVKVFLENVENPVVFFTTKDLIPLLQEMRPKEMPITFIEQDFESLVAIKRYSYEFWKTQLQLKPGRYSNAEIGIIWYEKKEFVKKAIALNPYESDIFIWIDVGCIRTNEWLSKDKFGPLRHFKYEAGTVAIGQVSKEIHKNEHGLMVQPNIYLGAAIYIGDKKGWDEYYYKYDEIMKDYIDAGTVAASDQDIAGIVTERYPDLLKVVDFKPYGIRVPNPWYNMLWTLQGEYLQLKGLPKIDEEVSDVVKECNCLVNGYCQEFVDSSEYSDYEFINDIHSEVIQKLKEKYSMCENQEGSWLDIESFYDKCLKMLAAYREFYN